MQTTGIKTDDTHNKNVNFIKTTGNTSVLFVYKWGFGAKF